AKIAVPLDGDIPAVGEPGGALLALLATLADNSVRVVYYRGGRSNATALYRSPYLYIPHHAIVPGESVATQAVDVSLAAALTDSGGLMFEWVPINGVNQPRADKLEPPAESARVVAWALSLK